MTHWQAAVESTFDVANWFVDYALNNNEYLQPAKLHRLLFLAQAYYAVANYGQRLMPSVFVVGEWGPVEPNVYRVFQAGRPYIEPEPLSQEVEHFLQSVWRRFGHHSADRLNKVLSKHPPYKNAREDGGVNAEIPLEAMREFYADPTQHQESPERARETAGDGLSVEDVLRPRVMPNQKGEPRNVNKWMPPQYKKGEGKQTGGGRGGGSGRQRKRRTPRPHE
mgnify:CR=1 FL=1